MKNKILVIVLCFIILFNFKVYAAEGPEVEAVVNGKIDKGETIQILINIKDIPSFFAGALEFKYDKNILKVKSIEQGDLISKAGINKFDAMNKIDEQNGIASYGFSCLGKINGFSGTGTFVKINAEILKKDSFHIKSKPFLKQPDDDYNLKLQICDSNIKELEYNFKSYEFNLNVTSGSSSNTNSTVGTNSGSTGGNTEQNKENTIEQSSTSTTTSANSSQNNVKSESTSKNSSTEENSNKSFIEKIITTVASVFAGDKKDEPKKVETKNKTESNNTKTEAVKDDSENKKNSSVDEKKEVVASDKNASNEAEGSKGENKSKAKVQSAIFVIPIISVVVIGGYILYRRKR